MLFQVVLLAFFFKSEAVDWGCPSAEPVCATDGKTYKDICEFNAQKVSDPDLQVLYEGSCVDNQMLKGRLNFNFRNERLFRKPTFNKRSEYNSKKYLLHFRTSARNIDAVSILDDCPQKCMSLCPRNEHEILNTLYITKSCFDCCRDW